MTAPDVVDVLPVLRPLEDALDPARPEQTPGLRVLAYGEVSACLTLPELPGLVCKRMSGFRDADAASAYEQLVRSYIDELGAAGVAVVPTTLARVPRRGRLPVVHLIQPLVPAETLGHRLLVDGHDATVELAVRSVLERCLALATANGRRDDGVQVALDAQLSNWSFDPAGDDALRSPVLLDVGTPFMRRDGQHLIDLRWLESPIPAGVRAYYRRRDLVGAYLDDYFDPRTVAVDLLGNFHKQGRPDRVPLGVAVVNDWLAGATDTLGPVRAVSVEEVAAYYQADAGTLELYLRLRRADRFVRTRVLRRAYDFVLPGPVAR